MEVIGRPSTFLFGGVSDRQIPAGGDRFTNMYGGDDLAASDSVSYEAPFNMIIDRMYYEVTGAPGVGETTSLTLMLNGIASALTVELTGVETSGYDLTHEITVSTGQQIGLRYTLSGAAGTGFQKFSMRARAF